MRYKRYSWILRLPSRIRDNPLGIFIAILCTITGILYAGGIANSNMITQVLNPTWLRVWGFGLLVAGLVKFFGNLLNNYPMEKLGCRLLSTVAAVYALWIGSTSGFRASATIALCLMLIATLEIRASVIALILSPPPRVTGNSDDK